MPKLKQEGNGSRLGIAPTFGVLPGRDFNHQVHLQQHPQGMFYGGFKVRFQSHPAISKPWFPASVLAWPLIRDPNMAVVVSCISSTQLSRYLTVTISCRGKCGSTMGAFKINATPGFVEGSRGYVEGIWTRQVFLPIFLFP